MNDCVRGNVYVCDLRFTVKTAYVQWDAETGIIWLPLLAMVPYCR